MRNLLRLLKWAAPAITAAFSATTTTAQPLGGNPNLLWYDKPAANWVGRDITLRGTPEFAAAVKKSLEIRGDRATGWATAWRICLWTHLGDGDHAFEIFKFLLSPERTYPNMFDAHPPFQIDGNFGGAAGLAEMLMQSRAGEIELLPALPKAWPKGSVKGLRARGAFEVDITWRDGKLVEAAIRSLRVGSSRLLYGLATREVKLAKGGTYRWNGQ